MKKCVYAGIIINLLFSGSLSLFGQVTISGPSCVRPGTLYFYQLSGSWDSASTMQVCVSGGIIKGKDSAQSSCTPQGGAPLGMVQVVWNDSGAKSLTVTSSQGNSTLTVASASFLQAGLVDSASQKQVIGYDSIPAIIVCGMDKGGSCSVAYHYQWQQSSDRVSWVDVDGATNKDLGVNSPMKETRFYRRKVIEATSGTIAYSDVAAVFVIQDIVIQ